MAHPLQAPLRRMMGLDVTRVPEYRVPGAESFIFVGIQRPQEPRLGTLYTDGDGQLFVYTGNSVGGSWERVAGAQDNLGARCTWRCFYCGTHFEEQRCPTCGAGRTEG